MTYIDFKNEWNGRRVDYDHVYGFQCVDLILEYVKECYGLPTGVWGNAIDYWNHPTPALLTQFNIVQGQQAQQGDIAVFNGLAGNPYGHIGIVDRQDASGIWLLEQNATGSGDGLGKSAIGVYRALPLSRLAGLLRPKAGTQPQPTPPPARSQVTLPATEQSWRCYRVGSGLRPNTSDQVGVLAPARFGGLTYKIEAWVGDYAVVIQTESFGRVAIWVKGTDAIIK